MDKIVILYGTETFNSYEYAVLLANKLESNNYSAAVFSMDSFELKKLLEIRVLIVISSTFGNGDNPKNTKKFWRFLLQKRLPGNFLDHIQFSTFGLGDSSYPKYNHFIKKVHARLLQLGAKELSVRGEGDEQSPEGVEAFYKEWEELLVKGIIDQFGERQTQQKAGPGSELPNDALNAPPLPPKFRVEVQTKKLKRKTDNNIQDIANSRFKGSGSNGGGGAVAIGKGTHSFNVTNGSSTSINSGRSNTSSMSTGNGNVKGVVSDEEIKLGEIVSNDRLTAADHTQDVRHVTIRDVNSEIQYRPGDIVSLYPSNQPADVEELIQSQGWGDFADYRIKINQNTSEYNLDIEGGLVSPLTLRSLITHHLDIMAIPRRSFFMQIYKFANDEREREKLKEFSEIEFTEDLYNYANRPRRSILETVTEFYSLKIPVEYVLEVFPILRPRMFSIASAPNSDKTRREFDLCVAIVKYRTIIKRIRTGVCTNWLKDLKPGTKLVYSFKRNDVYSKFPRDSKVPLVLIGPGTGIAPIRSIIQDKIPHHYPIYLFSGNRYRDKDFLYGEFFEKLKASREIHLFPAFSRDDTLITGTNKKVKYVQDMLYFNKELIYDLIINQHGVIYLCGASGRMPIQTRVTIQQIIEEVGGVSKHDAAVQLMDIENKYRYLQETW